MAFAENPILTDNQKALLTRFGASNLRDTFCLTGGTVVSVDRAAA